LQAADWTYVYVETSQNLSAAADRYDFAQMTPFESIVSSYLMAAVRMFVAACRHFATPALIGSAAHVAVKQRDSQLLLAAVAMRAGLDGWVPSQHYVLHPELGGHF
jgi:hypothetical protein